MKIRILALLLAFTFTFTLCGAGISIAHSARSQIHYFANSETGWIRTNKDAQASFSETSVVVCTPSGAQIYFEFAAESGDWIIYDKYSSSGDYFTREISFAATDKTIKQSKQSRNSRTIFGSLDNSLKDYEYLNQEFPIWTQRKHLPYNVPNCAAVVFNH